MSVINISLYQSKYNNKKSKGVYLKMDIKKEIKENNLRQWEIAENLKMSEFTLSRWLRRPEKLSQDRKRKIEDAIQHLKGKRGD